MTNREKVEQNMKETIAYFEAMSDEEFANSLLYINSWYRPVFIEIANDIRKTEGCPYDSQWFFNNGNKCLNWLQQEAKDD